MRPAFLTTYYKRIVLAMPIMAALTLLAISSADMTDKNSSSFGIIPAHAAPVDKNDRAMNVLVHMTVNGKQSTFDSFTKFDHSLSSMPTRGGKFSSNQYFTNPSFMLYSLPSKDKTVYYDQVFGFINSQGNKPPFVDITVDLMSSDNTPITTWKYRNCEAIGYWIYTDESKGTYRFSNKLGIEIRDMTYFQCMGFILEVPKSQTASRD